MPVPGPSVGRIVLWHNHDDPVDVTHAQLIAMTWDY